MYAKMQLLPNHFLASHYPFFVFWRLLNSPRNGYRLPLLWLLQTIPRR